MHTTLLWDAFWIIHMHWCWAGRGVGCPSWHTNEFLSPLKRMNNWLKSSCLTLDDLAIWLYQVTGWLLMAGNCLSVSDWWWSLINSGCLNVDDWWLLNDRWLVTVLRLMTGGYLTGRYLNVDDWWLFECWWLVAVCLSVTGGGLWSTVVV